MTSELGKLYQSTQSAYIPSEFYQRLERDPADWYCALTSYILYTTIRKIRIDLLYLMLGMEAIDTKAHWREHVPDKVRTAVNLLIEKYLVFPRKLAEMFARTLNVGFSDKFIAGFLDLKELPWGRQDVEIEYDKFHAQFLEEITDINISADKIIPSPVFNEPVWSYSVGPYMWTWVHFTFAEDQTEQVLPIATLTYMDNMKREFLGTFDILIGCATCAAHYLNMKPVCQALVNIYGVEEGCIAFHLNLTLELNNPKTKPTREDNMSIIKYYKNFWRLKKKHLDPYKTRNGL